MRALTLAALAALVLGICDGFAPSFSVPRAGVFIRGSLRERRIVLNTPGERCLVALLPPLAGNSPRSFATLAKKKGSNEGDTVKLLPKLCDSVYIFG